MKILDNILVILLVFFILLAVFSNPIAYWVHYEKKVYEQTEPVTWEKLEAAREEAWKEQGAESMVDTEFTGYPTKDMHTELKSMEQFLENMWSPICLEVDVKDLKPTGMYKMVRHFSEAGGVAPSYSWRHGSSTRISSGTPEYTDSYLETLLNRGNAIYAQYYVLELEDRSDIVVLLNDTVVEIPKKGTIQLPYATGSYMFEEDAIEWKLIGEYGVEKDESGDPYCLNASEWWMQFNDELEEANEERAAIFVLALVLGSMGAILMILIMSILAFRKN